MAVDSVSSQVVYMQCMTDLLCEIADHEKVSHVVCVLKIVKEMMWKLF